MKYMLFCCNDEGKLEGMSGKEMDAVMTETYAVIEDLRKSGHYIMSERLQPVTTAAMVRVRNGKISTTDGPFAETKEQIGGFWIIEAKDRDEAAYIAARFPSARLGGIEVRPLREMPA